jgi:hypothetical protein
VALGGFSFLLSSCSHRVFSSFLPLWRILERLPLFSRCALREFELRVVRVKADVLVAAWWIHLAFCSRSFTEKSSVKGTDLSEQE